MVEADGGVRDGNPHEQFHGVTCKFRVCVDNVCEPAAAESGAKVENLETVVTVECVSELSELVSLKVAVALLVY